MKERQKRLLSLLRTEKRNNKDKMITQEEICNAINEYEYNTDPFAHNKCIAIWTDVQRINNDPEIHDVIYYKDNKCKIASKEEAREYAERHKAVALKKMKRYWDIVKKLGLEGQFKLETSEDLERIFKTDEEQM